MTMHVLPARNVLSSRAMLATVRIEAWSGRRLDRKITDETNAAHGAAADAGRYNKALLPKDAMAGITAAANAARTLHYARTLPWLDEGARILPAAAFPDYSAAMKRHRSEFESAVESFVRSYPDHIAAARVRLNGMFDPADYPDPADIRSRFTLKTRVLPVPDAADFRVDMADAQAAEIRAAIEESTREALATAVRDVWGRIADVVGRMAERLAEYRPAAGGRKAEGIFRDSLVENVRELAAILPALNLTNDAALSGISNRIERELCRHDADALRESDVLRRDVAESAAAILSDVSAFLA